MSIRKEGLFEGQRYIIRKPGVMTLLNNFALPFHFFAKGTHYKSETTKKSNFVFKEYNFNIQFTGLKVYTALSRITNSTTGKYCSLFKIQ